MDPSGKPACRVCSALIQNHVPSFLGFQRTTPPLRFGLWKAWAISTKGCAREPLVLKSTLSTAAGADHQGFNMLISSRCYSSPNCV